MKQGWEIKKLGEVCTIERGGSPRPIKSFITSDPQGLNWIKIGDTDPTGKYIYSTKEKIKVEGLKKSRWVDENDFLLSNSMSFGRPYILKTNGCIHDGWLVLRNYHKWLNIDFFYYLLLSPNVQNQFKAKAQGSTVSNLNTQRVAETEILIPSLLEQGRIVGVLDAAFAKIDELKENAQKNLENAKALFQQVLKQELTPKPNWQTKKLGEIALKKLSYGASVPSRNFDGEYRYIRITDIDEDGKLLNDLVSPAVCEEKHILHSGDLLLARTGGTIGKSYLYSPEDGKCIYAGYLIRVIVNQDIVLPEFVFLNTKTDRYWKFIKTSQKTAAQPNINAQQYSSFDIPYPPKDEQEGIVRKIKSIFTKQKQLEKCCQKTIAECDALKQAVLRRAFNGEL